ncbi:MAG TPA: hypothetical protein P5569_07935 [Candidatus Latescibacteria bacterium]|nr:hypothetical protein [Candidatus Latescibacterota bacterium]
MNRTGPAKKKPRVPIPLPAEKPSEALYRLCSSTGVARFVEWKRRNAGVLFLRIRLCPSIRNVEPDRWDYDSLRDALRLIGRWYRFVSMDEAVSALAGRSPLLKSSVAVTVSIGSSLPEIDLGRLAIECDVPLTVFFCPGAVEAGVHPWYCVLAFALNGLDGQTVTVGGRRWLLSNYDYRQLAFADIARQIASLPLTDRYRYTEELVSGWRAKPAGSEVITFREMMRIMRSKRITFGVSGYSGDSLMRLPVERALYEIREGFALYRRVFGEEPAHFEYPWGDRSVYLEEFVRNSGYRSGTLGLNAMDGLNRIGADPFRLAAQNLRPRTPARIRADLAGVSKQLRPLERFLDVRTRRADRDF